MPFVHPGERLARWFEGQLPLHESPNMFRVKLYGGPEPMEPTMFHTFACLYTHGEYAAYGFENDIDTPLTPLEIRRKIHECTVPAGKAEEQLEFLKRIRGGMTPDAGWDFGVSLASAFRLPLIMYVYGLTATTRIETAFLTVMVTAPIERALQELKDALPVS